MGSPNRCGGDTELPPRPEENGKAQGESQRRLRRRVVSPENHPSATGKPKKSKAGKGGKETSHCHSFWCGGCVSGCLRIATAHAAGGPQPRICPKLGVCLCGWMNPGALVTRVSQAYHPWFLAMRGGGGGRACVGLFFFSLSNYAGSSGFIIKINRCLSLHVGSWTGLESTTSGATWLPTTPPESHTLPPPHPRPKPAGPAPLQIPRET